MTEKKILQKKRKRDCDDDSSSSSSSSISEEDSFEKNMIFKPTPKTTHQFILFDSTKGISSLHDNWLEQPKKTQLIFTSPPYYGCRDYTKNVHNTLGTKIKSSSTKQLGHESTPYKYVRKLCRVFAQGSEFLNNNGSLFIVIGDTFAQKNYSDKKGIFKDITKGEAIGIFGLLIAEMRRNGWKLWYDTKRNTHNTKGVVGKQSCVSVPQQCFVAAPQTLF